MVTRLFLSCLLMLLFANANAQIVLLQAENGEYLHVHEKQEGKLVLRDSIAFLRGLFPERSYFASGNVFFYVFGGELSSEKTYYINKYELGDDKELHLLEQNWISDAEHKSLFEKGLRVAATEKGLELSFTHGRISLLAYSYEELNLKVLSRRLSKIAKL